MPYVLAVRELIARGLGALAALSSLWFVSWGIRHGSDLDYPLDFTGKAVRWVLVVVLLGAGECFPGFSTARLILGLGGVAFLAWPNFAYHFTRFLRWCSLLPPARQPTPAPHPRTQGPEIFPRLRRKSDAIFDLTRERRPEKH